MQRLINRGPSKDAIFADVGGGGATGATGAAGATGAGGVTGATGAAGAATTFSNFFALMPGDNAATVAVGAAVQFPQNGPTNGAATRLSPSTFTIAATGTYEVAWQVSVTEAGQLMVKVNATEQASTVVGRATGTSQLVGNTLMLLTAGDVLSIVNPSGNSTALTITPTAGGTHAVSATLSIKKLA
jgi:hypothetical protein